MNRITATISIAVAFAAGCGVTHLMQPARAAAEHGLERVRAALQIDQFDLKARFVELAELLGEHGRQIAQAGAAPDRDGDLALRCSRNGHQHKCKQRRGKSAKYRLHDFLRALGWTTIEQRAALEKTALQPLVNGHLAN